MENTETSTTTTSSTSTTKSGKKQENLISNDVPPKPPSDSTPKLSNRSHLLKEKEGPEVDVGQSHEVVLKKTAESRFDDENSMNSQRMRDKEKYNFSFFALHGEPPEKEVEPPAHKPSVSWSVDVVANDKTTSSSSQEERTTTKKPPAIATTLESIIEDDAEPANNELSSNNKKVQLSDIVDVSALQNEAEVHIINILDQAERKKRTESTPENSIFRHVPDDMVDQFEAETEEVEIKTERQQQQSKPLVADSNRGNFYAHRRGVSVEQSLFELNLAITTAFDKDEFSVVTGDAEDVEDEEVAKKNFKSDADRLLINADKLINATSLSSRPILSPTKSVGSIGDTAELVNGDKFAETECVEDDELDVEMGDKKKTTMKKEEHQEDNRKSNGHSGGNNILATVAADVAEDWDNFNKILTPKMQSLRWYIKVLLFFLIVPATGIALIFFYTNDPALPNDTNNNASISWWILFLCVRQVLTLSLAYLTQTVLIDSICLGTRYPLRMLGPVVTLFIVQSKGWPFLLSFWGLFNFLFLYGPGRFAHHWLFWQRAMGAFNERNPSGRVIESQFYAQLLIIFMCVGVAVALKRLLVGLFLGRQTFANYSEQLATLMSKVLLVGEVASLAKRVERQSKSKRLSPYRLELTRYSYETDFDQLTESPSLLSDSGPVDDKLLAKNFSASERDVLIALLERWEEPKDPETTATNITISSVLQFRRSLTFMQRRYPFSTAFGVADTREKCIESGQTVYNRLLLHQNIEQKETMTGGQKEENEDEEEGMLHFDIIALAAVDPITGKLDEEKAKELVKLFRPRRNGTLTMLDFIKSIDDVYKSLRLLQANINNSSQIDKAFETMLNIVFYVIMTCIIISRFGIDPLTLFLSLSSVILAFAFMIARASSDYFQGMLFILVQRPYGVGDRIHVSSANSETNIDGSSGWIVEKVTLFTTTVYWGATNERATISNASLSPLRIINAARSPQAIIKVLVKFGIEVSYNKIIIFKSAVEEYIKARPREFLSLVAFRQNDMNPERGYIEYVIWAQHRESWQSIGNVLQTRALLGSYCLEVSKQLDMRYFSPPLPVSLKVNAPKTDIAQVLESGVGGVGVGGGGVGGGVGGVGGVGGGGVGVGVGDDGGSVSTAETDSIDHRTRFRSFAKSHGLSSYGFEKVTQVEKKGIIHHMFEI